MFHKKAILSLAIFCTLAVGTVWSQQALPCPADLNQCILPTCRCSSQSVPGNLWQKSVPQIVYLTFDDAISVTNMPFYQDVLYGKTNPNGALNIKGVRVPSLQTSGNPTYRALYNGGFTWESNRPTWNQRQPGLWPYTNDYLSTQDCPIPPCPTESFPGFWTIPMIDMIGSNNFPCAMLDECGEVPSTKEELLSLLRKNFNDQYTGNRAPFGIFAHASYFIGDTPEAMARLEGYKEFLNELLAKPDVYIVSISKAVEWMRNPTNFTVIEAGGFPEWNDPVNTFNCGSPNNCRLQFNSQERYMKVCTPCPTNYPWLGNPLGN